MTPNVSVTQPVSLDTGGQRRQLEVADWTLAADGGDVIHVARLTGAGRDDATLCGSIRRGTPYAPAANERGWPARMCTACREEAMDRGVEIVVAPPGANPETAERLLRGQERAQAKADGGGEPDV